MAASTNKDRISLLEARVWELDLDKEGSLTIQCTDLNFSVQTLREEVKTLSESWASQVADLAATIRAHAERDEEKSAEVSMLKIAVQNLENEVTILKRAVASNTPSTFDGGVAMTSKMKVPEPKAYGGVRSAKVLENFLWDMEQYFKDAHVREEEKVTITSIYLCEDAKLWWRTRSEDVVRGGITSWAEMKKELKEQFLPANVGWQARQALRGLVHSGTVRDYVKEFSSLLLDIKDMSDEDKLFNFVSGLQPWAQAELRRQGVKDMPSAVAAADSLVDLQLDRAGLSKAKGQQEKGSSKGQNGATSKDKGKAAAADAEQQGKKKFSGCFICSGDHLMRDCPKKQRLNAILVQEQDEGDDGSGRGDARLNVVQRIGALRMLPGPDTQC